TTTVPDEDAPARPDLVRRDFESPVPTYKLVGDTACLRTTSGFIYLATVIDLCTRMVAGRGVADNTAGRPKTASRRDPAGAAAA
ncbi:MAG: IS3 family transposase, partial [Atopobiaceae bacterium]|nr:IS3 family transposase [Atopobiaceae bacterium]